jgi:hypothetical protein
MGAGIAAGAHCALVRYRAGEGRVLSAACGFPFEPRSQLLPRFRRRPCGPRRFLRVVSKQASIVPRSLNAASRGQSPFGFPQQALRPVRIPRFGFLPCGIRRHPSGFFSLPCGRDRFPGAGLALRLFRSRFESLTKTRGSLSDIPSGKFCPALLPFRIFRMCGSFARKLGFRGLGPESGVGLRLHDGLALLPVFVPTTFRNFSLAGSITSCSSELRFFRPFPSVGPWPETRK